MYLNRIEWGTLWDFEVFQTPRHSKTNCSIPWIMAWQVPQSPCAIDCEHRRLQTTASCSLPSFCSFFSFFSCSKHSLKDWRTWTVSQNTWMRPVSFFSSLFFFSFSLNKKVAMEWLLSNEGLNWATAAFFSFFSLSFFFSPFSFADFAAYRIRAESNSLAHTRNKSAETAM